MQTSTQRAVPLEARKDLSVRAIHYMGANYWVVKDPVALKYFRFQPEQYKILTLLDGQRNLEQIRDEFHKEFPTVRLTVQDVQNLITDLHRTGLVYSNRMGQGAALVKRDRENKNKKFWQTLKNILAVSVVRSRFLVRDGPVGLDLAAHPLSRISIQIAGVPPVFQLAEHYVYVADPRNVEDHSRIRARPDL
jgi:hypothetical protein